MAEEKLTRQQKIAKALELLGKNQPAYHAEVKGSVVTIHFPHSIESVDIAKTVLVEEPASMYPKDLPKKPVEIVADSHKPGAKAQPAHRSTK